MHPLIALPYAAIGAAATVASHLPLPGDGKAIRALRARRGLLARFEAWGAEQRDPARPLLWMHAPSVGEGLQARPVVKLLRARHPEWQVVYTYFSPSAERFAASIGADVADYLPFDTMRNAERLLAALRPSAIVFAKLDLWPHLAERAARHGVPLGMIAATLAEGSGRRGPLARALLGDAYAALSAVGTIADDDGARLVQLGVPSARIVLTGDTRYDQVHARAAGADRSSTLLAPLASPRPTLVAGSTWPADESPLRAAWREVRRDAPDARLIIAPHEPDRAHLDPIRAWAREDGLSLATLGDADASHDLVLVDRVGEIGRAHV